MQREKKFRAWNKRNHSMHFFDLKYWAVQWIAFGDYEIMEYIGMEDKNGKEIYEGDIVRSELETGEDVVVTFETDIGSCGCCYDKFSGSGFTMKTAMFEPEVIGNIYENPELINN